MANSLRGIHGAWKVCRRCVCIDVHLVPDAMSHSLSNILANSVFTVILRAIICPILQMRRYERTINLSKVIKVNNDQSWEVLTIEPLSCENSAFGSLSLVRIFFDLNPFNCPSLLDHCSVTAWGCYSPNSPTSDFPLWRQWPLLSISDYIISCHLQWLRYQNQGWDIHLPIVTLSDVYICWQFTLEITWFQWQQLRSDLPINPRISL